MNFLLTVRRLNEYGGSELVTIELAEYLHSIGHKVTVFTNSIGGVWEGHELVTTEKPDPREYDVLWIQHNMLIHDLGFKKLEGQRIISNHMSSYVDLEWPSLPDYEMQLADKILANSPETCEKLEELGLRDVELYQNPAPAFTSHRTAVNSEPLMVSNHPPQELLGISGVKVGCDRPTRMSPNALAKCPFVICNGKTVQYALRAGVPVYLYDHFGGPGWLTSENFERAEWFNFSGRGFGFKTSDKIRSELSEVGPVLTCPDRFKLEEVVSCLLA